MPLIKTSPVLASKGPWGEFWVRKSSPTCRDAEGSLHSNRRTTLTWEVVPGPQSAKEKEGSLVKPQTQWVWGLRMTRESRLRTGSTGIGTGGDKRERKQPKMSGMKRQKKLPGRQPDEPQEVDSRWNRSRRPGLGPSQLVKTVK